MQVWAKATPGAKQLTPGAKQLTPDAHHLALALAAIGRMALVFNLSVAQACIAARGGCGYWSSLAPGVVAAPMILRVRDVLQTKI